VALKQCLNESETLGRLIGRIEDLKPYGSVPGTEIGRYRRDCWALRFLTPLNQKK